MTNKRQNRELHVRKRGKKRKLKTKAEVTKLKKSKVVKNTANVKGTKRVKGQINVGVLK